MKPSDSRTYKSWASMIRRCTVPTSKMFAAYGARGLAPFGGDVSHSAAWAYVVLVVGGVLILAFLLGKRNDRNH